MTIDYFINGVAFTHAVIRMPALGAWHADITVPEGTAAALSGAAMLQAGHLTMQGSLLRGGISPDDTTRVRVIGGAGGLQKTLSTKAYRDVPLDLVLREMASSAGETLAPTSGLPQMKYWVRTSQPLADALRLAAAEASARWRVLLDGTVWVGRETWPDASRQLARAAELLRDIPEQGKAIYGVDDPWLVPGVTLNGRRISCVEHHCGPKVRTHVWFDDDGTDRWLGSMETIVRHFNAGEVYRAIHPCTIITQNDDDTLELQPDSDALPGLSHVPMRLGVPGIRVRVADGSRVDLAFEGGHPSRPVATLWDTATATIEFNGPNRALPATLQPVARKEDPVSIGSITAAAVTSPPGVALKMTMTDGSELDLALLGTGTFNTVPLSATPAILPLDGKITAGAPDVKA